MKIHKAEAERHVLAITVDNEAGILAKIAGLFTARGYNIDSLTVADISTDHAVSRITIVTHGPPVVIDQIRAQLERLVPVHKVIDLTEMGPHVERELALVKVTGKLGEGVTSKDVVLAIIGKIGTAGGNGHAIEFGGQVFEDMSMEGRMTVCNMAIEAGARAGMIAPDEITFEYLKGRAHAPVGQDWEDALDYWKSLPTEDDAEFDAEVFLDANTLEPFVTCTVPVGVGPEVATSTVTVEDRP